MAGERLDKLVSIQLAVTRKEARKLIGGGSVRVNGEVVKKPDFKADPENDAVEVGSVRIEYKKHLYLMMNKPQGVISAANDPKTETVIDIIPPEFRRKKLFPVGRLDKDTEGLLIITDDGDFAHKVTAPSKEVFKVYLAQLDGDFTEDDVRRFENGLEIDGGEVCRPAKLAVYDGEGYNAQIHICEGKYHQVKRMAAAIGLKVLKLKRIRIGKLDLDTQLEPGGVRELNETEIDGLIKKN